MRLSVAGVLMLLMASLGASTAGCNRPPVELIVVVHGPAYPRPRCGRGPASLGKLQLRGEPVVGAKVILAPSKRQVLTDAHGRAVFKDLPAGQVVAQVFARGHRLEPGRKIDYRGSRQFAEVTLQPCLSLGRARLAVGFEQQVTLRPKNLCGKAWNKIVSYRWKQLEGPKIATSAKALQAPTLTFRTPPLTALRSLPPTPQILSFSHAQAGEHVFELEANNARGELSKSRVMVSATSVANGMTSVAPYDTYVFAGEAKGPWQWKLTRIPKGWRVNLRGETTRTPSVTPIPNGVITAPQVVELTDTIGALRFSIVLGNWNTVRRDCGRSECHRSLEAAWLRTPHAQTWKRLLDGELKLERGGLAPSCAGCHATGWDPSHDNGGYDDEARRLHVGLPFERRKGNYAKLPEAVRNVSDVYCLGCHGPGRLDPPIAEQPGLFGVGVCARCHDRPPEINLVSEWRKSTHAKLSGKLNGPERQPACARCHSAQGYYYGMQAISRPHSSKTAVLNCCETTQPITCQACHNPMRATARKQIYVFGPVKTPSGLALEMAGSGALCITCHHADVDVGKPAALSSRKAPHAPQADLLYGRAGFTFGKAPLAQSKGPLTCAAKTKDSCVTCHMHKPPPGQRQDLKMGSHTFLARAKKKDGATENIAACKTCHPKRASYNAKAPQDYDGDGTIEGAQDEIKGLLARLQKVLRERIVARGYGGCDAAKSKGVDFMRGAQEKVVIVDAQGKDLGDCDRSGAIEREERPFTFPDADVVLHKAAYNYLVVTRDRSFGLHNLPYTAKLLQQSLAALK